VIIQAGGLDTITRDGHLRLPARIRHACKLSAWDRLFVASPQHLPLWRCTPWPRSNDHRPAAAGIGVNNCSCAVSGADIEAARLLLARIGITPEQLLAAASSGRKDIPTLREYIGQLSEAVPVGTRRAYATY
jgi:hypothetical protein